MRTLCTMRLRLGQAFLTVPHAPLQFQILSMLGAVSACSLKCADVFHAILLPRLLRLLRSQQPSLAMKPVLPRELPVRSARRV
jgi:hypothetical protein